MVDPYYEVSPSVAEFASEHAHLRPPAMAALLPGAAIGIVVVNAARSGKAAMIDFLALVSAQLACFATSSYKP